MKIRDSETLRLWSTKLLLFFLYACVAAITLGANPFNHETITPFDRLIGQRAWSFVDPSVHVRQNQRSDILNGLLPQWETAKKSLRAGHAPLWNDRTAGGIPSLTVSSNLFTPAFAIFAATPDPALGFYLAILFNLAIAGLGMHLLLRMHVGRIAALTGAITFELCGFNAAWLYWPHVCTVIWTPWLLLAVNHCARSPSIRGGLMIAVSSALTCLGGFPFLSVLIMEAAALYALVHWTFLWRNRSNPWHFACWYAGGTVLGLLLAALPLLGLIFWLQHFDIGYRYGRGSYLDIHQLKQLFPPWAYRVQRVEQTMYVGAAAVGIALATLTWTVARWRRMTPISAFATLLCLIMGGLVFDLWPMWLIGWLPGMAYNSWSRAIALLDIALVILAALGIDRLWNLGMRDRTKLLHAALLALAVAQVVEISMFFRDYNGPVTASYYYPKVPSIEYMRKHTGPFDYVITDKSFGMSGIMGAYGLREWLAHAFRSQPLQHALQQMVENPFYSSPQSPSYFPASDIKYNSPAMAAYNVRYAAIDSRRSPTSELLIPAHAGAKHVALPAMPAHTYRQNFTPTKHDVDLSGISIRLATYRRRNLHGSVTLTLLDSSNQKLASTTLDTVNIDDNTFVDFHLDHSVPLKNENYGFLLSYDSTDVPPKRLTAWSYVAPHADSDLLVDGRVHPGTIEYKLHVESHRKSHFHLVFSGDGTTIYENDASPNGPYFISSITQSPTAESSRNVDIVTYRPAAFTLSYTGHAAGYIVVPMNINSDWHVDIDGKPINYILKDGVLPAVPITSAATIHFTYEPRILRWLFPWFATLFVALSSMAYVTHKTNRSARQATHDNIGDQ